MKKSFLYQRKLVDDSQKRTIREALLKCSAICGPDSDFESSKITSKFLDLSKVTLDEYACEGMLICIKWYLSFLEESKNKKDADFYKKLKVTYEEIERALKDQ